LDEHPHLAVSVFRTDRRSGHSSERAAQWIQGTSNTAPSEVRAPGSLSGQARPGRPSSAPGAHSMQQRGCGATVSSTSRSRQGKPSNPSSVARARIPEKSYPTGTKPPVNGALQRLGEANWFRPSVLRMSERPLGPILAWPIITS